MARSVAKAADFTTTERRLIARLATPHAVQRYLNRLTYNTEPDGPALRSFRAVARDRTAHCLEAVLFAATVLEQHGYPPLVVSFESADYLDHVLFIYRTPRGWGAIARSRDPGLHGRRPVFRTPRQLAASYREPYIDATGRIQGYAVVDLRDLGRYNWRTSSRHVWKVERTLADLPHQRLTTPDAQVDRWRARYLRFVDRFPGCKPMFFDGREYWSELPAAYRRVVGRGDTRRACPQGR